MHRYNDHYLLFDTNILIDAVCRERPESDEACRVLRRCNGGGDLGMTPAASLKDAYYVLERQYDERYARKSIEWLMELLVIAPMGVEECELSIHSNEPDFEDGLVRACAELNNVDFILTRDATAYRASTVRAMTCAEYLEICEG